MRLYAGLLAAVGMTAIQRGVASGTEHLRFFRRSPSDMSHAIGRLRQRLRDREHKPSE